MFLNKNYQIIEEKNLTQVFKNILCFKESSIKKK